MKKKLAIIGGGTAGLFLAAFLNTERFDVTIFEKKNALGRKFLVAGDGGFNLTHGENLATFKARYTPASFLEKAFKHFSNADLRAWLLSLGIPTFIGSSGRIFPEKGIKPIKVLKGIKAHLVKNNVKFEFSKTFTGWKSASELIFNASEIVQSDFAVFALGGASWKVTGSDGAWSPVFAERGIATIPFKPSNCAYKINWPEKFIQRHEGQPLKNITITLQGKIQTGEAVVTTFGIEGNAIYGLSPEIQSMLASKNEAVVTIDFKPISTTSALIKKLTESTSNTTTTLKETIKLSSVVVALIKATLTKEQFLDHQILANFIKAFPLTIVDSAPIDEAISTSGGISLDAVDANFELKEMPNHFCIGEMLDWDAPTGGYLIQGCASMGVALAKHLNGR